MSILVTKRHLAIIACLLAAAPAVQAAEPTIEQLMATPSAAEIVAQWKAVCLDHSGDMRAQRRAMNDLGVTWPYQVMFDDNREARACFVVSSTEAATTLDSLYDAVAASAAPRVLAVSENEPDHRTATITETNYEIEVAITEGTGTRIAVVALRELKRQSYVHPGQ